MRPIVAVVLPTPLPVAAITRRGILNELRTGADSTTSAAPIALRRSPTNHREDLLHEALKLTFLIPRCDAQGDRLGAVVGEIAEMLGTLRRGAGCSPRGDHFG